VEDNDFIFTSHDGAGIVLEEINEELDLALETWGRETWDPEFPI
jgi:hypothetical protein